MSSTTSIIVGIAIGVLSFAAGCFFSGVECAKENQKLIHRLAQIEANNKIGEVSLPPAEQLHGSLQKEQLKGEGMKHEVPNADLQIFVEQGIDHKLGPGFFRRVQNDALNRRFVQWNVSDLARGHMSAQQIPGRGHDFPYEMYYGSQGTIGQFEYKQVPMMKMSWDLQLYSMLLADLRPKTFIELGTAYGASAVWFADQANALGISCQVHSFDKVNITQLSDPSGPGSGISKMLQTAPSNVHFHVADTQDIENALPDAWLRTLPHPWVVIEDAHENTVAVAKHFFQHMSVGDYFIIEDIDTPLDSHALKRGAWFQWLKQCGDRCLLDLKYMDYFGVNMCSAPDGWMVKARN